MQMREAQTTTDLARGSDRIRLVCDDTTFTNKATCISSVSTPFDGQAIPAGISNAHRRAQSDGDARYTAMTVHRPQNQRNRVI